MSTVIEILKCGPLTTVQDEGRHGYRHLGIAQSGVMDRIAQQQANLLLDNPLNAAVLEVTIGPLYMKFHAASAIVLTGADFFGKLESDTPSNQPIALLPGYVQQVPAGAVVYLRRPALPGMRAIVAVLGGFEVPVVLGSRSTDINAGFGGHAGRSLQAGDRLMTGASEHQRPLISCNTSGRSRQGVRPIAADCVLRALRGPDHDAFSATSQANFWQSQWQVSPHSNRMGLRLSGKVLSLSSQLPQTSGGVLPGVVQVPPDGQPIILSCDAQTMGGYPRIASVIDNDLWQLAYMPPGSRIMFSEASPEQARQADRHCRLSMQLLEESLRHGRAQTSSGAGEIDAD